MIRTGENAGPVVGMAAEGGSCELGPALIVAAECCTVCRGSLGAHQYYAVVFARRIAQELFAMPTLPISVRIAVTKNAACSMQLIGT